MQLQQTLSIALLSLLLFACGGSLEGGTDTGGTDTGGTDTGGTVLVPVDITTRLLDCPSGWNKDISLCAETTEISALKLGVVAVHISQGGVALAGQIITATVSKGGLQPDTAYTDSNGLAFFTLVSNGEEGAGRITVTTDAKEQETADTLNFEIGASNVVITIENDTEGLPLAQNSTALITVNLTTDEGAYTSPVTVTFSSACATAGTSKLDESVTAVNGIAQATYQPIGCVGDDLITASAQINSLSASTTVTVASSPADSISFLSATPVNIAIKGTGGAGRQETSKVLFKVVDQSNLASSLQNVEFELDHAPLGTTIDPIVAKTNADGEVYTVVSSGKVAGPVKVKVKLSDPSTSIHKSVQKWRFFVQAANALPL